MYIPSAVLIFVAFPFYFDFDSVLLVPHQETNVFHKSSPTGTKKKRRVGGRGKYG
jgi:hypothetical protein